MGLKSRNDFLKTTRTSLLSKREKPERNNEMNKALSTVLLFQRLSPIGWIGSTIVCPV